MNPQIENAFKRYDRKESEAIRNYRRAVIRNDRRRCSYWFHQIDHYSIMALKAYGRIVIDENNL